MHWKLCYLRQILTPSTEETDSLGVKLYPVIGNVTEYFEHLLNGFESFNILGSNVQFKTGEKKNHKFGIQVQLAAL